MSDDLREIQLVVVEIVIQPFFDPAILYKNFPAEKSNLIKSISWFGLVESRDKLSTWLFA